MRLFKRDPLSRDHARAIASFWQWWQSTGRDRVTDALADGDPARVAGDVARAVAAVHPGLDWELAPGIAGTGSTHLLVVGPGGAPELRALARRWLQGAPSADAAWAYADARQPAADLDRTVLTVGEQQVALAQVLVGARVQGARVDVLVHHPAFRGLDEAQRQQVAFLALDAALGENEVEAWVGVVEPAVEPPLDGFPLAGLRSVVRDLRRDHTDPEGRPTWTVLQGEGEQGPVMALAQVPLSPVTAPELDTHVAVLVPYTDLTAEGYPGPGSLDALRALEDQLTRRIGTQGRLVAHQSHRGMRVLHLYVDSTTPAVEQMRAPVDAWRQGRIRVQVTPDPGWRNVAHLRA